MTKILIYSDNHFCASSSILRGQGTKYSLRLENQIKTMSWLNETAVKHGCIGMFCAGDFFDRADLNAQEITALGEIDFSVLPNYFIVGNHELGRGDCSFSSTHTFLQNNNCEVFTNPAVLGFNDTLVYILPYTLQNDARPIKTYFSPIDKNYKHKILIMHNDIKGIQLGRYITENGFDKEDLSSSFDLVVNGHIHNQNWVTSNVLNIGNITGQNFSEDAFKYKHQAMIIDLDTLEYELITNPYALNFYKIDWSNDPGIDVINEISKKMSNAVLSLKVSEKDSEYLRYRFDPNNKNEELERIHCPKNCNILCTRIVVDHTTSDSIPNISVKTLQLDHVKEFQQFVINNMEYNDIVKSELQEILK